MSLEEQPTLIIIKDDEKQVKLYIPLKFMATKVEFFKPMVNESFRESSSVGTDQGIIIESEGADMDAAIINSTFKDVPFEDFGQLNFREMLQILTRYEYFGIKIPQSMKDDFSHVKLPKDTNIDDIMELLKDIRNVCDIWPFFDKATFISMVIPHIKVDDLQALLDNFEETGIHLCLDIFARYVRLFFPDICIKNPQLVRIAPQKIIKMILTELVSKSCFVSNMTILNKFKTNYMGVCAEYRPISQNEKTKFGLESWNKGLTMKISAYGIANLAIKFKAHSILDLINYDNLGDHHIVRVFDRLLAEDVPIDIKKKIFKNIAYRLVSGKSKPEDKSSGVNVDDYLNKEGCATQ